MNKNFKFVLIFISIFLILFLGYLTYYKLFLRTYEVKNNDVYVVGNKVDKVYEIDYVNNYKDSIIHDTVNELEYYVTDDTAVMYGKMYIDSEGKLYITNELNNSLKMLLDGNKVKNLKRVSLDNASGLVVYALCSNGELYLICVNTVGLENIIIKKIDLGVSINNFTSLKFKGYLGLEGGENVVLASNGKMYDITSKVMYNPNIINVFDEYLIFEDDTISTINGNWIVAFNEKKVEVKSIISLLDSKEMFEGNPNSIIITDDNRLIYLKDDETIYEYGKVISKIDYSDYKFVITFIDKTSISFEGYFDENVYPVK